MGSYGYYTGSMDIPEEKREAFSKQVVKLLNYGGMMQFEIVKLFGYEIALLRPIRLENEGKLRFHYNYFEEEAWEDAFYYPQNAEFFSEKIGSAEFCRVASAVYLLYEFYDDNAGTTWSDWQTVGKVHAGWINHILGASYSMEKRFRIWENVENLSDRPSKYEELEFIPRGMFFLAGGTELSDLFYITNGTSTLTPDAVVPKSYPADVYSCKISIKTYIESGNEEDRVAAIWSLIKEGYEYRRAVKDPGLQEIAKYSFILPARVIVYLTAELTGKDFWDCWKGLKQDVYHDERMRQYESDEIKRIRTKLRTEPIPPVKTADFLRCDHPTFFYDTPEMLKGKPNYVLTDDDRLYWWDGTDEVMVSDVMDNWLKELAHRHHRILQELPESGSTSLDFLREFLQLLSDTNKYYKRIYPFGDMFYEFLSNSNQKEYIAAIGLFRDLAEENKPDAKIIEMAKGSWTMTSRNVTHNIGRLQLKRYLSVMANPALRKQYFGF